MNHSVYDFECKRISGENVSMSEYADKVLLIVNTASACGFTPQYKGMQALYEELSDKGLEILGFPCNQFGKQEKGDEATISEFCELNYGITFSMFAKIEVNGGNAHPLYDYLKQEARGLFGSRRIKWNFTKFLVNKDGKVLKRYSPITRPEATKSYLEELLA